MRNFSTLPSTALFTGICLVICTMVGIPVTTDNEFGVQNTTA